MRYETAVAETAPVTRAVTGAYADVHGIVGKLLLCRAPDTNKRSTIPRPVWTRQG